MALTQSAIEDQANRHRTPAPKYLTGDKVWLSTANIKTQRPSKKLDYKQIGPFEILGKIGPTSYKLKLPDSIRIYPVFHFSLFKLHTDDPLRNQIINLFLPVIVKGEQEWEVEEIINSRYHYGRLQYKAKWVGYNINDI